MKSAHITVNSGSYEVYSNDALVGTIKTGKESNISIQSGAILMTSLNLNISSSSKLEFLALESNCELSISPEGHSLKRKITGHLNFWNRGMEMSIINTLDLDVYISGVVEAEAGSQQNAEYYKVQAVICRTYALANKFKHAKSGFHLCDEVHCQVYKGVSKSNPEIISSTISTSDVVVVNQDISLITTAFHSNCGGHTINSEDVWTQPATYLKAVPDTFCLDMPHADWEREVKKTHWMGFFKKKGSYNILDSLDKFSNTNRTVYFADKIHLKDIRSEFNLRSTLFTVKENGENITIQGKGFGHGVGLCQEGAMKMSSLGYNYMTILHYYFSDIHVVPLSNLHLFQEN
ncbi:MAG: SpoIID/LytB domain-containing protein [Flavobacteriales bacterium]